MYHFLIDKAHINAFTADMIFSKVFAYLKSSNIYTCAGAGAMHQETFLKEQNKDISVKDLAAQILKIKK